MTPVRIAIVDDSYVIRRVLELILGTQEDFKVIASVANGKEALEVVDKQEPDILLLDIEMPVMDGITTLKHLLRRKTRTKVIVLSTLTAKHAPVTIHALSLGAAAYLQKPSTQGNKQSLEEISARLFDLIRSLIGSPILEHEPPERPVEEKFKSDKKPKKVLPAELVVIGASTGGPNALSQVLRDLVQPLTVPLIIVQHMPASFIPQLANRLQNDTGITMKVADNGLKIEAGVAYIGPGDIHTELRVGEDGVMTTELVDGPLEVFCKPSVNPLFRTAAKIKKDRTLGVILTGMGEDGLDGARHIRAAGGRMIAQDSATSVVWGMPKAVVAENLANEILPLADIGHRISELIKK